MPTLQRVAPNDAAFSSDVRRLMSSIPAIRLPLERGMCNQSMLDGVMIILTNKWVGASGKLEPDQWDAVREHIYTLIAAVQHRKTLASWNPF